MKLALLTSILALIITGCAAPSRLTNLENVQPNEVAVIAKFSLSHNGSPTSLGNVVLSDISDTSFKVIGKIDQFQPDGQNYIFAKLLVGKHYYLQSLVYGSGMAQKTFQPDFVSFDVKPGGPQYLGDVSVDLIGIGATAATAIGLVTNIIGQTIVNMTGDYTASVTDDAASAQLAFNKKFGTTTPLTLNLGIAAAN